MLRLSSSHEGPIKGPSAHVELRLKETCESPSRSRVLRGWRLEAAGTLWVVGCVCLKEPSDVIEATGPDDREAGYWIGVQYGISK